MGELLQPVRQLHLKVSALIPAVHLELAGRYAKSPDQFGEPHIRESLACVIPPGSIVDLL